MYVGDGADRAKDKLKKLLQMVNNAGNQGVSTLQIKNLMRFSTGITPKRTEEYLKVLKALGFIREVGKGSRFVITKFGSEHAT